MNTAFGGRPYTSCRQVHYIFLSLSLLFNIKSANLLNFPTIYKEQCFFVPPSCILSFNLVSTNTQKSKNTLSELTQPSHSAVWQNYVNVISFAELVMCNSGEFLNFCKTLWILIDTSNIVNDEAFQYLLLHKVETILQQDSRNIIYIYQPLNKIHFSIHLNQERNVLALHYLVNSSVMSGWTYFWIPEL